MLFKIIRAILSPILLFLDWITSPKSMVRAPDKQAQVDQQTQSLELYEFRTCPFCIKVRRAIKKLNLKIQIRDARNNQNYMQELIEKGGQDQVPCLKITEGGTVRYLFESSDIVAYLNSRFS